MTPFGYDDTIVSSYGALTILGGLIGGAVAGIYVEKTLKYKKTLVILSLFSLFAYISLFATFNTQSRILTGILVFIYGFMVTPVVPMGLDFGCELVFPVGEALSSGILMSAG